MAVTLSGLTNSNGGTTQSRTVGTIDALLVFVTSESSSVTDTVSATYGGVAMTLIGVRRALTAVTTNNAIAAFILVNPTPGTANIAISGAGWTGSNMTIHAFDVAGLDTTNPIGGYGEGSRDGTTTVCRFDDSTAATDAGVDLINTSATSLLVGAMTNGNTPETVTQPAGWTVELNSYAGANAQVEIVSKAADAVGTNYGATQWNITSSGNRYASVQFELMPAGGSTETVDVSTPGALTITGQNVDPLVTVPVTNGSMSIAGQAVAVNDTIAVTNGALTITGQTVNVTVQVLETVTVTDGALTIAGQTVTVTEIGTLTVTVDPGALTLTGQDVTVTETAPPVIRNRAIGGGGAAYDPRFIKAEEARRAKERDLWQRIDDDLNGRQRAAPEAAPAPPERETKPLPVERGDPIPAGPDFMDLLMEAMNKDAVSTLMLRHDLPYYDPEEDAAVLLLLS